jgi:hypothetical protein
VHERAAVIDSHHDRTAVVAIDHVTLVPKGKVRCAAVKAPGSIASPLAV